MEIRLAKEDDLEDCVRLNDLAFKKDRRKLLEQYIRHRRMYVAMDENRLVGFITFDTNFIGCLYISLLMVHPQFRRRGIARKMIEKVASHSENGKLFSSTEADNEISIKMHEALGFIKSGYVDNLPQQARELIYYKDLSRNS